MVAIGGGGPARNAPLPTMSPSTTRETLLVFPTSLGWTAAILCGPTLRRLSFGHPNANDAARALDAHASAARRPSVLQRRLIARIERYAAGHAVAFGDVAVDLGPLTEFQSRVYGLCRQIPYGDTLTYGQLASLAGSPGAARAVGNCMAANPIPLVVPCHRVVGSQGSLGGYSGPGGTSLKRTLLDLESGRRGELA
jgi:methylated-DNA-[protein]-cysteine S-methyltransferase